MKIYTIQVTLEVEGMSEQAAIALLHGSLPNPLAGVTVIDTEVVDERGVCDCGEPALDLPGESFHSVDGEHFYCRECYKEAFGDEILNEHLDG